MQIISRKEKESIKVQSNTMYFLIGIAQMLPWLQGDLGLGWVPQQLCLHYAKWSWVHGAEVYT